MSEREHRVREIAHRLWEEEGRPADQEKRHWATAERMLDTQERTNSAATGKRRTARTSSKRTPAAPHTSATQTH